MGDGSPQGCHQKIQVFIIQKSSWGPDLRSWLCQALLGHFTTRAYSLRGSYAMRHQSQLADDTSSSIFSARHAGSQGNALWGSTVLTVIKPSQVTACQAQNRTLGQFWFRPHQQVATPVIDVTRLDASDDAFQI